MSRVAAREAGVDECGCCAAVDDVVTSRCGGAFACCCTSPRDRVNALTVSACRSGMKGKGKKGRDSSEDECPLQFLDFDPLDVIRFCPRYNQSECRHRRRLLPSLMH